MTDVALATEPTRILAVVPRGRLSGFTVLDRWGLVDFGIFDLHTSEDRERSFERGFDRLLTRTRPAIAIVGTGRRDDAASENLRGVARHVLRQAGVRHVLRHADDARLVLLGRLNGRARNELADRIVRGFFHDLEDHLVRSEARMNERHERERYWRGGWNAAALAVVELGRRHPFSAAALAHAPAFEFGTFGRFIAESTSRNHHL